MRRLYQRCVACLFGTDRHVLGIYRVMRYIHLHFPHCGIVVMALRHFLRIYSSCDISPKATIGKNLIITHPLCVVIGDGVAIGDNVKIWQQVTLGSHGKKEQGMSYPTIGDGVRIYVGSTVIGGVTIGDNAVIGAHSLVITDVPEGKTAVGSPARIINP